MDIDKFAEGYREPPSYQRYRDEDPELRAFLEGPRKQASIFDRFATLYLKGGLTDEPEKIYRTLIAYEDEWLMPHLPATERQARKLNQQA
ncbi:hypothetical protein LRY29_01685, partial [Candidatus Saccharibacteria bacterium]|nr:hypothetical protein [Candidatus Saccharibacteria bacterium]